MLVRVLIRLVCAICFAGFASAQESTYSFAVPITIAGAAEATSNFTGTDESLQASAGFRAVISPELQLGPHWLAYSALEVRSSSYLTYKAGPDTDQALYFNVLQAFIGYQTKVHEAAVLVKIGGLASAFGYFPAQYDDMIMWFPDAPPTYTFALPLRADQRPCGTADLLNQPYGNDVVFRCGNGTADSYGLQPVALRALSGFETDLSWRRVDLRMQATNSSPANPQSLISGNQAPNFTYGGGYTLWKELHIGASAFLGPYLDRNLDSSLAPGTHLRDFFATGVGIDAQWARGPWSINGEWQRFRFELPGFVEPPSVHGGYMQVKRIVSPRFFLAGRVAKRTSGRIVDDQGFAAPVFTSPQQVYELGAAYRPNRNQILKVAYEWVDRKNWSVGDGFWPGSHGSALEVQLAVAITPFSKVFR